MLSADLQIKLTDEFNKVKLGKNPKVTQDIEAILVLSGESQDPAVKTHLPDTEERLSEGISIYKKVQALGGSPTLILNGTDPQNAFMKEESRKQGIHRVIIIKNPPYPLASTKTQVEGIKDFKFTKMAIITHAYHGPRTRRYINKFLSGQDILLFLINRNKMSKGEIKIEMQKIKEYFPKEFANLK